MNRKIYKHKDNVRCQLNAGISASAVTIPLKAGNGAQLPVTYSGAASSLGSSVLLNSTGIGVSGVAIGDIIENVTDGSYSVITAVATNSVATTRLKGGSDNTWQNADKWAVNRFIITLIHYDADGVTVLKREKVLIDSRSGDNLTVNTLGRGFDGSTAQSFSADDYLLLFLTSSAIDGIGQSLSQVIKDIDDHENSFGVLNGQVVHNTGNESIAGIKTFSSIPILPASDPTDSNHAVRKSYVDSKVTSFVFGGTGADGALTISSGTTTIDLAGARYFVKNYTSISITGTGKLAFSNPHSNGTSIIIKATGNVTVTSSTVPAIDVSGLGASGNTDSIGVFGKNIKGQQTVASSCFGVSSEIFYETIKKVTLLIPGSGGGNYSGSGGARGGGALMIECGGSLNITSTFHAKGNDGGSVSPGQSPSKTGAYGGASILNDGAAGYSDNTDPYTAGGGGGGGGMIVILYMMLTANSATLVVTGGGSSGEAYGGTGGLGLSFVGQK